jgi:hypothetical protein
MTAPPSGTELIGWARMSAQLARSIRAESRLIADASRVTRADALEQRRAAQAVRDALHESRRTAAT